MPTTPSTGFASRCRWTNSCNSNSKSGRPWRAAGWPTTAPALYHLKEQRSNNRNYRRIATVEIVSEAGKSASTTATSATLTAAMATAEKAAIIHRHSKSGKMQQKK